MRGGVPPNSLGDWWATRSPGVLGPISVACLTTLLALQQSAAGDPFTIGTDEHRVRTLPATGWATIWHTDWPGSTR
jgi:hypothetical protein